MLKVLTVSELTGHIKNLLDKDPLLLNLWVKGEISNCKQAASGHLYFTLKDEFCSIKAIMFRSRGRRLLFQPEDGMAVRVRGYVSVYPRDGTYQLYVEEMEPEGTGALYLAFEQLKQKLEKEGLFAHQYKKKLPLLPRRIGIVTSPTGAVLRDMVKIIRRRWPGLQIIFVPVSVQGESAPREVARALHWLNRLGACDVIIVGRGGGSLEELWAFNTEVVARSIFASDIPVISAVGHETDFTIADWVADVRAPTPSAAAEMVVPVREEMARYLGLLEGRLLRTIREKLQTYRARLDACRQSRVFRYPVDVLCGFRGQMVDDLFRRLKRAMEQYRLRQQSRLALLSGQLQALSPLATLARGYSICTRPDTGEVVRRAGEVAPGEKVQVELYRGRLFCQVEGSIIE
ncbi:exodeoxyribonuclease VII large subunit [Desulfofundulus salinus]|uniref:Exodeoxyribonuclease 7 large subunit n=1 Tax=Desulfofundulus salinus TaxID=2419843 RepID=A0A494WTQ5_9FIRM|nr:exodeoxyribonuclease VII large subunit [Desulfofundulus salinum]RKO66769.1 exodeoxyribonuclease VII large subunit [Desulfofundulus salinum]